MGDRENSGRGPHRKGMDMVTVGICDDEASMRRTLRAAVELQLQLTGCEYRIVETASGNELLAGDEGNGIDILFLDIEMPGLSGMETAGRLRERGGQMLIVFVTSHPDFVFQGYEVHAFHYILKPYQEKKIAEVLTQALGELEQQAEQFLTVELRSSTVRLPLRELRVLMSDKRKVVAFLEQEQVDFYAKLDETERKLPPYFFRIHNRYVVNLHYVTKLDKDCCFVGGMACPVSRACRQKLEVAFARFLLR